MAGSIVANEDGMGGGPSSVKPGSQTPPERTFSKTCGCPRSPVPCGLPSWRAVTNTSISHPDDPHECSTAEGGPEVSVRVPMGERPSSCHVDAPVLGISRSYTRRLMLLLM